MVDKTGTGVLDSLDRSIRADFETRATARAYPAGTTLFHEGDPSDWVLGVVSGQVKVSVLTDDGREVVLAVCGPGEILGELSAVDGRPRSATASAIDRVDALLMTVDEFHRFLDDHPQASMLLLRTIAERLRDADRRDVEYAALDSIGRVSARLVELGERFGSDDPDGSVQIELSITQDELAGWTGCSREAVGKALHQLRNHDVVATSRRRIRILDPVALRARAGL